MHHTDSRRTITHWRHTVLCLATLWGAAVALPTLAEIPSEDRATILKAAREVSNGENPYAEAVVLKHINEIHQLRSQGLIEDSDYQRLMSWHQTMNLMIAEAAAKDAKLLISAQRVAPDKADYRPGSDSDYLVKRADGRPLTLEDVQAVERAYRIRTREQIAKLSNAAGRKVASPPGHFNTTTDFMADVEGTGEGEFNRIVSYLKSKGSDVYGRYDAACVEAQIRRGDSLDARQSGAYVNEMIDQANYKKGKIEALNEKLAHASVAEQPEIEGKVRILNDELKKYVDRLNDINARLAVQAGRPRPPLVTADGDFAACSQQHYTKSLAALTAKASIGSDNRRRLRFMLGLQVYDLPAAQREGFLNGLDPEIRREVKAQVDQFVEQEKIRATEPEVSRLRKFLSETEGGRQILEKYDGILAHLASEPTQRPKTKSPPNNAAEPEPIRDELRPDYTIGTVAALALDHAMATAMLLEAINAARHANSDAELAIGIGKVIAANSYYGMMAGFVSAAAEGDPTALAKAATLYLCPQAAVPQLVQTIGDSTIDLTTSVLFDHQFNALYAAATNNPDTGELLGIGDLHGSDAVNQFVDDALIEGSYKLVEGVFDRALVLGKERNLSEETLSGFNVAASMALVKALKSTIYGGAPQVMKDDPELMAACGEVNACTSTIDDFVEGCGFKGSVPREAGVWWLPHPNLTPAQQRVLKQLMALREKAWEKAKKALCAGIKANLESRYRAATRLAADNGDLQVMREKLEALFRSLDMYDLGMSWLTYDAGESSVIFAAGRKVMAAGKEHRVKAMETLQRYYSAYSAIDQLRSTLESQYRSRGGQNLSPRPLTGAPPMTADPAFDRALAAKLVTDVITEFDATEAHLLTVKREALNDTSAQLDTPFDRRIDGALCGSIISLNSCLSTAEGTRHGRERLSRIRVMAIHATYNEASAAFGDAENWRTRIKRLTQEFEDHYKARDPALAILPAPAIVENRAIAGNEYSFRTLASNLPPEAVFTWYVDKDPVDQGPLCSHAFEKAGTYTLRVVASWKRSERTLRDGQVAASITCVILPEDADAAKEPSIDIVLPDAIAGGSAQSGIRYVFTAKTRHVPDDATLTWYRDRAEIGKGSKLTLVFEKPASVFLAVAASWDVPGSTGPERIWSRTRIQIADPARPAALAIIPPPDALAGEVKPKESYLFAAAPENIPASAAYRWSYNGKVIAEGTTLTLSFPAEGTYPLELTATWATSETSPNGGLAKATCSVKVAKPPETPPEPTPPATAPETPVTGTTLKTDEPPTPVVTTQDNAAIPVTAPATPDKQTPPPEPKTGVTPPPEPPSTETKTTPPPSVNSQAPSQGVTATGAAGGDVFYGSTLTLAFSAEDTYTCPKCGAASPKKSWRESRELSYSTKAYDVTEIFIYCPKCNYRWALDAANKPQKQEPPPPPSNADYTAAREAERQAMLKQLQDPNQNKLSAYDGFTDKLGKMSGQTPPPAPQPNTSGGSKWGQAPFSEAQNPVASDKPDGIRFPSTTPAPTPAPKPATTQPSGKRFVYQSSPTLTFNPPESTDGKTEVTFDRLGTVRIWAVIYTEGSPKPVETPQRTYVVKAPAFAIACSPEGARVGQEVRAQVSATPPIPAALVRYVWAQPPSSARMEYSQNSDQIGFKPADTRPVALSVEARVPHYGDVIGTATAAYEPSAYTVTAELVGRTGPKPMVWDTARGGLVPVPDGTYLVDEAIGMKATLTGGPRPDPIRWQWTVNEGTTLRGSGLGDSIAVTRSEPGGATATVTARDKDGNLLGTATADCTFSPHPPEVPLTIAVTAAGAKLKSGQQTTLHAAVKGGKAPYAITWTGAQGQGETAVLTSGKAGVQRITASVRDGAKGTASASIDVTVEAVPLNVTIAATTRTVRCGEALQLRAEARGGTPPYRFTWTGTASANNDTASFQQLRAGTAPVSVHALDSCDNSGDASITLTVNALTVKAEITGITGQPALLWDEAAHALKPAAGQHAVGQGMRVRASVVDGVLPAGAAFTWTAAGAGQLTGEARGPEAAIAFTGKGTVQATVVLASDTAGILGQAAVTATVGIGQPEIDEAKRKQAAWDEEQKKEKQAQALIEEGFALEKKGDFEGAIAKYKAALALKSDQRIQQRITTLEQKIKARDHARELISLAESCERSGNLKTALDTYQRALDIAPSEDIRQRMKRLNERLADALRAQGLVNQGYDQEKAGHMPEAIALYEEALGISPDTKLQAHCADLKTAVERNAKLQDLVNQGYAFEKAGKLQEALAAYRQALSANPDDRLQQRIDQIKVRIDAEQARLAAQTATQAIFLPEVAPVTPAPQPRVAAASPSKGSGPASPPAVVPATPARTAPSTSPSSPPPPPATVPSSPRTPAPAQVTTAQAAQPKAASTATTARSRNLTGVYQCTASADGETGTMTLTLRQEGARVTGSFKIVFSTGELKGHDFNEDFSATIDGDKFIVAGSDKAARIATDGSSITLDVPDQGTMVFKRVAP